MSTSKCASYSYIFHKDKLDIEIFVTGLLGGLVGITGKMCQHFFTNDKNCHCELLSFLKDICMIRYLVGYYEFKISLLSKTFVKMVLAPSHFTGNQTWELVTAIVYSIYNQ